MQEECWENGYMFLSNPHAEDPARVQTLKTLRAEPMAFPVAMTGTVGTPSNNDPFSETLL